MHTIHRVKYCFSESVVVCELHILLHFQTNRMYFLLIVADTTENTHINAKYTICPIVHHRHPYASKRDTNLYSQNKKRLFSVVGNKIFYFEIVFRVKGAIKPKKLGSTIPAVAFCPYPSKSATIAKFFDTRKH